MFHEYPSHGHTQAKQGASLAPNSNTFKKPINKILHHGQLVVHFRNVKINQYDKSLLHNFTKLYNSKEENYPYSQNYSYFGGK